MDVKKEEDVEDPIVEERNVYLNKQLMMYLLRFPLRPANSDMTSFCSAKIKPKQREVELESRLEENSHYSKTKAAEIACNSNMDADIRRIALSSSITNANEGSYAVAFISSDGNFNLCPVTSILEMRPSLNYLDSERRSKDEVITNDTEEKVSVHYARKESDAAKAKRLASYDYHMKNKAKERWISLDYRKADSRQAVAERSLLVREMGDNFQSQSLEWLDTTPDEYAKKLLPAVEEEVESHTPLPYHMLSLSQLRTRPLLDQVKQLLRQAKVMKFSQLQTLVGGCSDSSTLLWQVQQVGLLIQGCWVLKSEILYDESQKHLVSPRDFVLWKFVQSRDILRKDLAQALKISPDQLKNVLLTVARSKGVTRHWEFLMDTDKDFIDNHPETVHKQQRQWIAKQQELQKILNIDLTTNQKRRRQSSTRIDDDTKSPKVRSRHTSGKSQESPAIDAKSLNDKLTEVDREKSLQSFIKILMTNHHVLSLTEIRRQLNMKLAQLDAGHPLTCVSEVELEEAVTKAGSKKFGQVFVMMEYGDGLDIIRQCVLDKMNKDFKVRIGLVKERVEEVTGKPANEAECKRILKDMCSSRGSLWVLKNSVSS
ncbi:DgyrCDS8453 [Dimorphilus gyrociliatus]|uniref:DgyrCDS8453 n=1 Tax=Dimorphilus gyrociliatus TaxID=2664684 RepID=A0A7I8VU64_9ANNE|nr:DgyrCDS8453 [Dimorphilus gyrociliatus]